jgi:DNA-binding NarL/FixJ family response regulator
MNLGYQGGNSSAVPNKPVRVIAVDDHPLTRRGVAEELRDDARLEVLGAFPSFGAVPLPLRTPSQVQVAVIDLAVRHETRGVESVALVAGWGIPSVVYTMHGSAIIRDEALKAGPLRWGSSPNRPPAASWSRPYWRPPPVEPTRQAWSICPVARS